MHVESLEPRVLLSAAPVFEPAELLGSMVYLSNTAGELASPGAMEDFTVDLDVGQTLTITIESQSAELDASLALKDPGLLVVAAADAHGVGSDELIQTYRADTAGSYTVEVAAVSGAGAFNLRLLLNAAVEASLHGGPVNNTLATAQPIDASFVDLEIDGAVRAAVVGQFPTFLVAADDFEIGSLGPTWVTYTEDTDPPFVDTNYDPVEGPIERAPLSFIDLTDEFAAASGRNSLIMYRTSRTLGAGGAPEQFTLNEAIWTVNLSGLDSAFLNFWHAEFSDTVDPFAGDFADHFAADGVAISDDGVNWHPVFTAPDQPDGQWRPYAVDLAAAADAAGMNLGSDVQIKFQQYGGGYPSMYGGRAWDSVAITTSDVVTDLSRWYRFDLTAGEVFSLAVQNDRQAQVELALFDAGGALLATGEPGPDNLNELIVNLTAPDDGPYYARLNADALTASGSSYILILTRGASLSHELGRPFAPLPQDIAAGATVLGNVGRIATDRLFAWETYANEFTRSTGLPAAFSTTMRRRWTHTPGSRASPRRRAL